MAQALSKSAIRKLYTQSREARMWASEQLAKAADSASDDDISGYQQHMAEAARLTLVSAKYLKAHREAAAIAAA